MQYGKYTSHVFLFFYPRERQTILKNIKDYVKYKIIINHISSTMPSSSCEGTSSLFEINFFRNFQSICKPYSRINLILYKDILCLNKNFSLKSSYKNIFAKIPLLYYLQNKQDSKYCYLVTNHTLYLKVTESVGQWHIAIK